MIWLTIAGIWLGASVIGAIIFHFCLSPRRFEKHRSTHPLPSNSILGKPQNGAIR